jgi:predicted  nucleic acid-binding Zn-ribbon protein
MSLRQCAACGHRFATVPQRCRRCGHRQFRDAPVRDEPALAQASTALWVGVPDPPAYLTIAQLSDVAVLATSAEPVTIGQRLRLDDRPDGGFTARPERSAGSLP